MTRSMKVEQPIPDADAPRARTRLTLRDVVAAARSVLAGSGVDGLTMSAVAARLDVTPMALYRHVDNRAALLAAVAESVLEPVGAGADPDAPWDEAVVAWMRDARRNIVENPWAAQLIGTTTQISPAWAGALDHLLTALDRSPLDDTARAEALVWIARTTIGVVLLEARAPLALGTLLDVTLGAAPPETARRWARIDAQLTTYQDDELFEDLVRQTRSRLACFEKQEPDNSSADAQDLTDAQWQTVHALLPQPDTRGAPAADDRRVVDGLRFRTRTGSPWRTIPARYGSWQTLYDRHKRWTADGTWPRVLAALGQDT